jgi:NAD(P)-dependent dehydrogenase (short-subunit alcohol dehydrogenase family)
VTTEGGQVTDAAANARQPGADDCDVRGTTALITGGGRGVGRLLALRLAAAGAAVGLIARSPAQLSATVAEVERSGGSAAAAACDVTDHRKLAGAVADLASRLGPVNLLINNAGVSGPAGRLWEVGAADWWRTFEINVCGAFTLSRLVLPGMVAVRNGRIINITSYAGVYRWPLMSAYAASKAALVKLTETLAEETRSHGIAVFSADPGLLPIGLGSTALQSVTGPQTPEGQVFGWIRDRLAAGRGADPADATRLVLALSSGRYDRLSGRHFMVSDDMDALLSKIDDIEHNDLHTLRLRR